MKTYTRTQRIRKIQARIRGTAARPRVVVQRTARHLRVQAIDDGVGRTVVSVADDQKGVKTKGSGMEQAKAVGVAFADKAKKAGVTTVVFDRRGYRYHGRVQAFADALRESGIEF